MQYPMKQKRKKRPNTSTQYLINCPTSSRTLRSNQRRHSETPSVERYDAGQAVPPTERTSSKRSTKKMSTPVQRQQPKNRKFVLTICWKSLDLLILTTGKTDLRTAWVKLRALFCMSESEVLLLNSKTV